MPPFCTIPAQSAVLGQVLLQNWDSLLPRAGFLLLCRWLIPHTAPIPTCVTFWSEREAWMKDGFAPSAQHPDGSRGFDPLARSKGKACGGWSWLHIVTPKRLGSHSQPSASDSPADSWALPHRQDDMPGHGTHWQRAAQCQWSLFPGCWANLSITLWSPHNCPVANSCASPGLLSPLPVLCPINR